MTAIRRSYLFIWLLPFVWLWFVLISQLRVEWTLNPQYGYGWAVPFLCGFLIWRNIRQKADCVRQSILNIPPLILVLLFALCALLYAPSRLIQEANPDWRLVSWTLAIEVVGLTLLAIRLMFGARALSQVAIPIAYFLVAVPWPTVIESPLIQRLTHADAALTVEFLGWFDIPAMPHGNVIEVATGMVGIDEACSGIRSFQATLMISLFLGEFYRLSAFRRSALCFVGFALSVLFNLMRMSLLVWVAARKGVPAIASWHDPAGVSILVSCFFCLWGLGVWLARKSRKLVQEISPAEIENQNSKFPAPIFDFRILSGALAAWLVLVEASVERWYCSHEGRAPVAPQWIVAWPTNKSAFTETPFPENVRQILRYDEGNGARWRDGDQLWEVYFLRWNPGRAAVHLAQNHTPDICLTASGHTLKSVSTQEWFGANGLRLPFSINQVTDVPQPIFIFYCLWDDRAGVQGFTTTSLTYGKRLAPVLAGLRNPGQRSLEIAVAGPENATEAEVALREELPRLIQPKP